MNLWPLWGVQSSNNIGAIAGVKPSPKEHHPMNQPIPKRHACLFVAAAILGLVDTSAKSDPKARETLSFKIEGKTLNLIGKGVREFLFIDIYNLAAYSESGTCAPKAIVQKDEIKLMRLTMLKKIPKERLVSNLRKTFTKNLPPSDNGDLKKDIDTFLAQFKGDIKKGSFVEILYIPGKGTLLQQNGQKMGPYTPGKGFAKLVWKSYFGPDTCCKGLKSDILEQCRAN